MMRHDRATTSTTAAARFETHQHAPDNDRHDMSLYVGPTVNDWGLSLDQYAELIRAIQRGDAA